jgi:type III restriction enzyme
VLGFLSNHFAWDDTTPAGELELVQNNGETVQGTLILMSEWRAKLPALL